MESISANQRSKGQKSANSINLIRLLAALQVFFGHANVHLKTSFLPGVFLQFLNILNGVPVFFMLSGFLIWHSIANTQDLKSFCKKRVFRLYPELWGGVLVNFLLIAALLVHQIQWIPYLAFQLTQGTFLQFWTPDFLRVYGCGTPNGSLWTICVMLQAYMVMWFVYKLLHGKKLSWWIGSMLVSIGLSFTPKLIAGRLPEILCKLYDQTFVPYFWLFMAGMLLSEFFEKWIAFLKKYWYLFALGAWALILLQWDVIGTYGILGSCLVAPAMIGFAYRFPKIALKHDYSYGVYIYHMVVINVMIYFGITGAWWTEPIALAGAFLLAVLSYHTLGMVSQKKRKQIGKERS